MKRAVQTAIGITLVAIVVARISGTETRSSASGDSSAERVPSPPAQAGDAGSFANANWSLQAEPGAIRKHQRLDPATGTPVPLTEQQRESSEYDGQSAIERDDADDNRAATDAQVSFGDPDSKIRAVR